MKQAVFGLSHVKLSELHKYVLVFVGERVGLDLGK